MRPKKQFSQNFLCDEEVAERIVVAAGVEKGDFVLEVGPGTGALTRPLIRHGAEVVAVELDAGCVQQLKKLPLTVYQDDILSFPLEKCPRKGKVVANLPYHITAPILSRLVVRHDLFSTITVMVQEEVAQRITALPQTRAYGLLTLFLQIYATAQYLFRVDRTAFYPIPKVDSAVVTLTLHDPVEGGWGGDDPESFLAFARLTFQQKRKMMKNALLPHYPEALLYAAFDRVGIDRGARPEAIPLSTFVALYRALQRE